MQPNASTPDRQHMQHLVAYFSPAGSTRLIAETIRGRLTEHGQEATMVDLGKNDRNATKHPAEVRSPCCLWIGSPVYCDHAAPPVTDFIKGLPIAGPGSFAVLFVAWGGVTSGLALAEMAEQLLAKGFVPLAAAKVLAVHSSMWRAAQPLASGHPDREDLAQMRRMTDTAVANLASEHIAPLDLRVLDYLSPWLRAEAAGKSLAAARAAMPPLAVNEQHCLQCGECAERCPTAAISLAPFPTLSDDCVLCLQCVRGCPQDAFVFDNEAVAARIGAMADRSDEEKATRIFP